jgi:hypothetical protein
MDLIDEKEVHHSGAACANCGGTGSTPASSSPASQDAASGKLMLCSACLEDRYTSLNDLRIRIRKQFDLSRSPNLRSCFLNLLLSHEVDLEPSGWRTSLALGCELKDAGFSLRESNQILIAAGANSNSVGKLLNAAYARRGEVSLRCEQIRVLDVVCDQCPHQFLITQRENKTEIL